MHSESSRSTAEPTHFVHRIWNSQRLTVYTEKDALISQPIKGWIPPAVCLPVSPIRRQPPGQQIFVAPRGQSEAVRADNNEYANFYPILWLAPLGWLDQLRTQYNKLNFTPHSFHIHYAWHLSSYGVEVFPGPLGSVHLFVQLLCHDVLSVCVVQVSQVHCRRGHTLYIHMSGSLLLVLRNFYTKFIVEF